MKKTLVNLVGIAFIASFMLIAAVAGCSKKDKSTNGGNNDGSQNPTNLITINNFAFSPQSLTVSVGDTVTWRNDQGVSHTVTSDQGSELGSGNLSQGQTYQHIFTQAGLFPYHCTIHPNMTGQITVQ